MVSNAEPAKWHTGIFFSMHQIHLCQSLVHKMHHLLHLSATQKLIFAIIFLYETVAKTNAWQKTFPQVMTHIGIMMLTKFP
jgi:hypothetical protein